MASPTDFATELLRAWQRELGFMDLLASAAHLEAEGKSPLAVVLYQTWLARNASEFAHVGHFNLGAALFNLGEVQAAEQAYRKALELSADFLQPRINLGLVLERQGRVDEAIAQWQAVADRAPNDQATRSLVVIALNHLGRVHENRKQFGDALAALNRSLALDPAQPDALHHWVFLRQKQCAWPVYQPIPGVSEAAMREATSALAMISVSDDPQAQLEAAKRYVRNKLTSGLPRLAASQPYRHTRIRIGYCSSDFCLHPVALLTVQMLELHDRDRFEVYGYCWSPEDGSATRKRVIGAMDHFRRIHDLSDEQAAKLIRADEIDVLIDLQGQTSGARANILGWRPAPIQITYLGLPATTGLPSIDYVIADRFLIPPESAPFYSEKPLYMPDVYQVSDRARAVGPLRPRTEWGLPPEGFVFSSFNNTFKYTPAIFGAWMRILQRVPGSVLWLLADNRWAEANLRREAQEAGVDPSRLVFADRVSPENYLARMAAADLFLDSFPFNAGTTANDCLWVGCPLLTLSGRSFASRMAGALLSAADMPELITETLTDYEERAVALAGDPAKMQQLRERLRHVRDHGRLFDTPRFVRELEQRLLRLVQDLG